jgi:hypothetical protein
MLVSCQANAEIQAVLEMTGSAYTAVQQFKKMPVVSSFVLAGQATAESRARPSDEMGCEKRKPK